MSLLQIAHAARDRHDHQREQQQPEGAPWRSKYIIPNFRLEHVFCLLDSCSSFNAKYRSSLTRQSNELCNLPGVATRGRLGAAVAAGRGVADRVAGGHRRSRGWESRSQWDRQKSVLLEGPRFRV